MEFGASVYIAIGFPLLVGLMLVVLFRISLKDYFTEEEPDNAEGTAQLFSLGLKEAIYVCLIYIASATVLGLI